MLMAVFMRRMSVKLSISLSQISNVTSYTAYCEQCFLCWSTYQGVRKTSTISHLHDSLINQRPRYWLGTLKLTQTRLEHAQNTLRTRVKAGLSLSNANVFSMRKVLKLSLTGTQGSHRMIIHDHVTKVS